jgi:hypothetical protein
MSSGLYSSSCGEATTDTDDIATHTCARALAGLLETGSWDQDFPEAYMLTPQRLERQLPDGGYVRLITGKVVPPSAKA